MRFGVEIRHLPASMLYLEIARFDPIDDCIQSPVHSLSNDRIVLIGVQQVGVGPVSRFSNRLDVLKGQESYRIRSNGLGGN